MDLLVGDDTIRIFNNHLHSTAITVHDDKYLSEHQFLTDTAGGAKIKNIFRRFRDNSMLRAAQADTIARAIAATPGCKIVCGDFNDTPMSYTYRVMAQDLDDAFRASGKGYSYTFRGFMDVCGSITSSIPKIWSVSITRFCTMWICRITIRSWSG